MARPLMKGRHVVIDARVLASSTGTVLRMLLPQLELRDRETRYTVIVAPGYERHWKSTNPNFSTVALTARTWSLATQTQMTGLLRRLNADLVWFYMPDQPILYRGCTLTTIFDLTMLKPPPRSAGRPWRSYLKLPLGRMVYALVTRTSDVIMVSARSTQAEIIQRYGTPADKFALVHCGVEVRPGLVQRYPHPFDRFLLYVGQHGWHKDIMRLCEAHQRLLDEHPDLGLILVGKIDPQVEHTRAHVLARGYRNIIFTGFLPDDQRDWLYRNAAAYVFPSLLEGFGLPGLEAMGFGTPVISSDATCLPEIYGNAAHYFHAGDTADLARAIDQVLRDPALRDTLATRGPAQYQLYSYERMADEMLALFRDTLARCDKPDRQARKIRRGIPQAPPSL